MIVAGIGNAWRGDDGAGLEVARRLGGVTLDGDATWLLEAFGLSDTVVVVDASEPGGRPGTVRRYDARAAALPTRELRSSTHAFGVAGAIELGRALGTLPPMLEVYAIEGRDFSFGASLSPEVASAVESLSLALAPGGTTITAHGASRSSRPLTPPTRTERSGG
jgi:hydrogenase maturation protease